MTVRSAIVIAHRWLGLATSLVLVTAGLTGALLVGGLSYPGRGEVALFHINVGLGPPGAKLVLVLTAVSVLILLSGIYLWWRTKTLRVRVRSGWRTALIDLHYALGAVAALFMLLIALTGVMRPYVTHPTLRSAVSKLHTGHFYGAPVSVVYALGSLAFVVEGVTGVVMWWQLRAKKTKRTPRSPSPVA